MTAEWSPTGQLSACCGPTVKIWTPGTQDGSRERKINEGTPVYAVDWSTNNKVLAVAGDKAQVSMYSGSTVIGQVPTVVNPHIDTITCMRFSHSSKKMVIGCKNRTMHILDLRQQDSSRSNVDHRGAVVSVCISPDDTVVASSSVGGQLVLHDQKSGAKLMSLTSDGPTKRAAQFGRTDAGALAAGLEDGSLALWDVRTRQVKQQLPGLHPGGCTGLCFAPGSSGVVFTCGKDGRLVGVDLRKQQEVLSVPAGQPLSTVAVRPDGVLLAAGTSSGGVLVFDVRAPTQPLAAYRFSDNAAVHDLRWQNVAQASSSKGKAAAAAAAPSSLQQPARGAVAAGGAARATSGAAGGAAAAVAARLQADGGYDNMRAAGDGLRGEGPSRPNSTPSLTPETSRGSDIHQDGLPAVSPVKLGDSPGGSASLNTGATSSVATTPSDALGAAGGVGAFMATPGYGVTRGLGGLAADVTPVSRYAPVHSTDAGGAARAVATQAKQQVPANLTGFTTSSSSRQAAAGSHTGAGPGTGALRGASKGGSSSGSASAPVSAAPAAGGVAGTPAAGMATITEDGVTLGSSVLSSLQPPSRANSTCSNSRPGSRVSAESSGADVGDVSSNGASTAAETAGRGAAVHRMGGGKAAEAGGAGAAAASATKDQQLGPAGQGAGGQGSKGKAGAVAKAAAPAARATALQQQHAAEVLPLAAQQLQVAGAGVQAQHLLREDVFTAYVDSQMQVLRADVRALHVDMIKQFQQAQLDLASVMEGIVARQDALAQQVADLSVQLQQCVERKADISLAWM